VNVPLCSDRVRLRWGVHPPLPRSLIELGIPWQRRPDDGDSERRSSGDMIGRPCFRPNNLMRDGRDMHKMEWQQNIGGPDACYAPHPHHVTASLRSGPGTSKESLRCHRRLITLGWSILLSRGRKMRRYIVPPLGQ